MRNTWKVAKWELKRNLKNKSFLISLFSTPVIFLLFMIVPSFFSDSNEEADRTNVYVKDELGVYESIEKQVEQSDLLDWNLEETTLKKDEIKEQLESDKNAIFIPLTEAALQNGSFTIYTGDDTDENIANQAQFLKEPLKQLQLERMELTSEEKKTLSQGITFQTATTNADQANGKKSKSNTGDTFNMERLIPGVFAGIILFSIMITGMMIFQSASQEKKDKIAEIILSSLTPEQLMQGKIVGYFILGILQVFVFFLVTLPTVLWKTDIPIMGNLFVPELPILVAIAILGYLLFASLFVGIGATIEDISTSGNFQGIVLMLPFVPFILLGPILADPNGLIAQIGSYIPITAPGVLIIRLSLLNDWPWPEIAIAIVILLASVLLSMKLAGKIFKTGILLYGKTATPKEIWKWIRSS